MFSDCVQPPQQFQGHYEEFPTSSVLSWNDFVPASHELSRDYAESIQSFLDSFPVLVTKQFDQAPSQDVEQLRSIFEEMGLHFSVKCSLGEFDLVPNGREVEVNEHNFSDYVLRYQKLCEDFDNRRVALSTLEDDPSGLTPLLPRTLTRTMANNGQFQHIRLLQDTSFTPAGTGWLPPRQLEFSTALPFPIYPTHPSIGEETLYTAVFLFCLVGDRVVCKCVGWARQSDVACFRQQVAPQSWLTAQSSINMYRDLSHHVRGTSRCASAGPAATGRPEDTRLASSHVHTVRELRNGSASAPSAGPHAASNPQLQYPPAASNGSEDERIAKREAWEQLNSDYMRRNAQPAPTTQEDKRLFSPTHANGNLFAPIQALTL